MNRRIAAGTIGVALGGALVLGAAPAGAATVGSAAPAPSAKAAACDKAAWQGVVQGRPTQFKAGARGGDYIWHDSSGFHLRVTHAGDRKAVYSGAITANAPMRLERIKLEGKDSVALSADHKLIRFSFADYGHIDGINFHTDCASAVTFSKLAVGKSKLPASRVYLGAKRVHPHATPFTVHRRTAS
ncbi:hypothetical protein M6D93_01915 [Jatrophihabitans telluris]|uniref:Uncharacterized protein n=1 Tax=Jatrophihabitans telluris TaxID=2038343 RepID=A0ABY4QZC7_9ACTN|nr:hypothetical protein [Jatrophihabitans telluris]UQX88769.1 hypothetical protein M6D93_01915 [Jatrophihabitans telluris]